MSKKEDQIKNTRAELAELTEKRLAGAAAPEGIGPLVKRLVP